jgi:hypothetical protein
MSKFNVGDKVKVVRRGNVGGCWVQPLEDFIGDTFIYC